MTQSSNNTTTTAIEQSVVKPTKLESEIQPIFVTSKRKAWVSAMTGLRSKHAV